MATSYDIETIADAIEGSGGIVNTIAARLGCSWHTAKKQIFAHEETAQQYQAEKEIIIDQAETIIKNSLSEGDISTAKWVLTTIGKDRGYSERAGATDIAAQVQEMRRIFQGFMDAD